MDSVGPVTYSGNGSTATVTVVPDSAPQSQQTSDLVERLRADVLPAAEQGTTLDVHVGGITAAYDDFAQVIIGKLPLFVGVVIALGCLLLLLAFRSLGIPLKAAAMNVAAVASAFGIVVAIFQWGWGSELLGPGSAGPIEPFLPVIAVSVLFGLSMDYQVFLVSRMYEEWLETRDNRRAVRVGLAETSRVINSAAVIMIAVFLAFVLSGDRVIAMFGIGLAAAVALDAFVLRTLLPGPHAHAGRANWWLPRPGPDPAEDQHRAPESPYRQPVRGSRRSARAATESSCRSPPARRGAGRPPWCSRCPWATTAPNCARWSPGRPRSTSRTSTAAVTSSAGTRTAGRVQGPRVGPGVPPVVRRQDGRRRGRLYAIRLDGTLVGGVMFRTMDPAMGTCEVGCWLEPPPWGAAWSPGRPRRSSTGLWRCAACTVEGGRPNTGYSINVAKRLGMTWDGVPRGHLWPG